MKTFFTSFASGYRPLLGVICLMSMAFFTNCGDVNIDRVNVNGEGTVIVEPISEDETVTIAEADDATEATTANETTTAATDTEETATEDATISTEGTPDALVMDEEDAGKSTDGLREDAEPYENIYFDVCDHDFRDNVDQGDSAVLSYIQDIGPALMCGSGDTVFLVEANKLLALGMSKELINARIIENEYYIITSFEYELASDVFEEITRDSRLNLDFCIIFRYYEFNCPDVDWDDVEFNSCQLTRMNDANLSDCLYQEIREYFET